MLYLISFDSSLYAADSMAWRIVTYVSVSVAIPTLMAVCNIKRCSALWLMLLERYTILFIIVTSIIVMSSLYVTMKWKRFRLKNLLVRSPPIASFYRHLWREQRLFFILNLRMLQLESLHFKGYIAMIPYSQWIDGIFSYKGWYCREFMCRYVLKCFFKVSKDAGLNLYYAFYQHIGDFRNVLHCNAWRWPEVSPFSISALPISRPLA